MTDTSIPVAVGAVPAAHHCPRCAVELAPDALACPGCLSLLHANALKGLAARADALTGEGRLGEARQAWEAALALLPVHAPQHVAVVARIEALDARISAAARAAEPTGVAGAGLRLLDGGKLLAMGLTHGVTVVSMVVFAGVYGVDLGWGLALGLVAAIYAHEMGHVAVARRLGIGAGAPVFVPGLGAMVPLDRRIADPVTDAAVGLAGPVWGLGAGLLAYGAGVATGAPVWMAIAQLTGLFNLLNLAPVWQLDGARGFHALSRPQRWTVVAALAAAFALSGYGLLILVAGVAAFRAWQPDAGPGDGRTLATFVALVAALTWLMTVGGGLQL